MASGSAREEDYEDDRVATKVDQNFHCAVCRKILKEPVMCPRNQHLFRTGCITEQLNHSQTCPTCKHEVILETLMPAPRAVTTDVSELDIRCEYHARGCPEFVQVGMLKTHVANCGFSPVVCRNEGCTVEINKRDRIRHETEVCELRKVQCHECTEMKKEMNEVNENLSTLKDDFQRMRCTQAEILKRNSELKDELQHMRVEILRRLKKVVVQSSSHHGTETREKIFVVGGMGSDYRELTSVEMFSTSEKRWVTLQPIKTGRVGAPAFVYKNQIFVAGGYCVCAQDYTNTIETMTINQDPRQWREFPARLPAKLEGHKCVVYNDRVFVVGGYNADEGRESVAIYEVLLTPPYTANLLNRMPQPRRCHSVELYHDRILIFGRKTGFTQNSSMDSIAEYDISENEYRELAELPYAVNDMATVRWGTHVIVMGGFNENGEELNTVVIFDIEKKECHTLPPMKHRRKDCAAVVSGNSVVVMGGVDENGTCLKTVECFKFDRYTWEELPSMTVARRWHSAVVL